jgi:hypothetical protein
MNTGTTQIFSQKQGDHGVWQDKEPQRRFSIASRHAYHAMIPQETAKREPHETADGFKYGTAQKTAPVPTHETAKLHGSETRKTAHVAGRIPPPLKDEFLRIAKQNHWTESYAVRMAIQQLVEDTIGEKLAARLDAAVTCAIERTMKRRENREANLLAKIFYRVEHSRLLFIKILSFVFGYLGYNQVALNQVVETTRQKAGENISKHIPQPIV